MNNLLIGASYDMAILESLDYCMEECMVYDDEDTCIMSCENGDDEPCNEDWC